MEIIIRPAKSDEMEEARRVSAETVALPPGIISQEFIDRITPEMTLCAFVDGKMAATYASWPFQMRFNGKAVSVAGVSFVGTLPVYRRLGCLRKITSTHFEDLYNNGKQPITILFASQAAIYQRYGYGIVSTQNSYNIDPRDLNFTSERHLNKSGRFREADDDLEIMNDIYTAFIAEKTGYLERAPFKWKTGCLSPPAAPGVILDRIIYEENGKPMGYFVYTVEPFFTSSDIRHKIMIRDMAWLSSSALYGIWNFFKRMDMADIVMKFQVPCDDPLPCLLLEPKKLKISSMNGFLARIVDIARAVPERTYKEDGELTFEILDEMCPWNNGIWNLKITEGNAEIKKTDNSPEVSMSVDSFAMILFGRISATQAFRMGRIDAFEEESLCRYDRIFWTDYAPFCGDVF